MSFRIEEQFIKGKAADQLYCEDRIVVTPDFVAVIDGATSKSDLNFGEKTQGIIAGELIEEVLAGLPPNSSAPEFIERVNERFFRFYKEMNLVQQVTSHPVDRLNASAAIFSKQKKEVWLIGDCQCLIGENHFTNAKLIDDVLSQVRSIYLELALLDGATVDELLHNDIGRDAIMPLLKKQQSFQNIDPNNTYAYGTLDGFVVSPKHFRILPVIEDQVVLASDGYPSLLSDLESTELALKDLLNEDPLCIRSNRSTKGLQKGNDSFDDRAYVRLSLF